MANTSNYIIRFIGNKTVPGQFHLSSILSKLIYQRAGNIWYVFYFYISHTRVCVCTARRMRQLEGRLDEKTERPRGKHGAPIFSFGDNWRNHFYINTVLLWRMQNPLTFLRQSMNFMGGRLLLILLSEPFPYIFCFRVMLMGRSEKQTFARSLCPLVALLILVYLSTKSLMNKGKRWLNEYNSMMNILR